MRIVFIKIDHVQLVIPEGEEERAREFYGGLLGLEEIEKPDLLKSTGGVWYKIGDAELHLGINRHSGIKSNETAKPVMKKEHPAFEISGLADVKSYLKANGVNLKEENPIHGRERFSFYDPFWNRIEFLEYFEQENKD